MAADTRPYKSKEQDGQGNEIILRDQQLVEQASQTTMASGEYFEIVDVDGRMAKIPKANMVDIVREALGSLLNGLTDQTTVTKVPSLNGNTLGASTVATLASVLGGIRKVEGYPANIDNINFNSTYHTYPADSQGTFPSGYSATTSMDITTVVYGSNARTQYVTCGGTSETHVRHYDGATWSPWVRMDNFGCSTAADLASLLGGTYKSIDSGDINDYKTYGVYNVANNMSNAAFTNAHTLIVLRVGDYVSQIAIDVAPGIIKFRTLLDRTGRSWEEWRTVQLN